MQEEPLILTLKKDENSQDFLIPSGNYSSRPKEIIWTHI
jgi:hypothetical protein